ncbi:hypothetical protein SDC9_129101 [bioreactor metagenome]|uniref:Uncharacterized protein n=1 Tax=bioreactor metagenome TaxID=1076179 RepID=A0A645CYU8_9ZZZZ
MGQAACGVDGGVKRDNLDARGHRGLERGFQRVFVVCCNGDTGNALRHELVDQGDLCFCGDLSGVLDDRRVAGCFDGFFKARSFSLVVRVAGRLRDDGISLGCVACRGSSGGCCGVSGGRSRGLRAGNHGKHREQAENECNQFLHDFDSLPYFDLYEHLFGDHIGLTLILGRVIAALIELLADYAALERAGGCYPPLQAA